MRTRKLTEKNFLWVDPHYSSRHHTHSPPPPPPPPTPDLLSPHRGRKGRTHVAPRKNCEFLSANLKHKFSNASLSVQPILPNHKFTPIRRICDKLVKREKKDISLDETEVIPKNAGGGCKSAGAAHLPPPGSAAALHELAAPGEARGSRGAARRQAGADKGSAGSGGGSDQIALSLLAVAHQPCLPSRASCSFSAAATQEGPWIWFIFKSWCGGGCGGVGWRCMAMGTWGWACEWTALPLLQNVSWPSFLLSLAPPFSP
ncbi:hypothetical protein SEVIR_9G168050v4 [Setaria viridis]